MTTYGSINDAESQRINGHSHNHDHDDDDDHHYHHEHKPLIPLIHSGDDKPWLMKREQSDFLKANSNCEAPKGEDSKEVNSNLRVLIFATVLCTLFMAGEVVGGYIANSLAIMTDAAHLLSDVAGFLVSICAIVLSRRRATSKLSFGFYRVEILGAIVSVLIIWALTGVLLAEAIERIQNPSPVDGKIMTIVAGVGIVVNVILGLVLGLGGHAHSHGGGGGHGHSHGQNINVRSAFVHVLGDLVQTVGVLIAGIIIWIKPEYQIADPISTFVFSVLVLFTTITILRDAMHVLMEGTPAGMDIKQLHGELRAIPNVASVHDLHVWSITMGKPSLSVHIETFNEDQMVLVLREAEKLVCQKYGVHHTTIQVEPSESGQHHCASCDAQTEAPPPPPKKATRKNSVAPIIEHEKHFH